MGADWDVTVEIGEKKYMLAPRKVKFEAEKRENENIRFPQKYLEVSNKFRIFAPKYYL